MGGGPIVPRSEPDWPIKPQVVLVQVPFTTHQVGVNGLPSGQALAELLAQGITSGGMMTDLCQPSAAMAWLFVVEGFELALAALSALLLQVLELGLIKVGQFFELRPAVSQRWAMVLEALLALSHWGLGFGPAPLLGPPGDGLISIALVGVEVGAPLRSTNCLISRS